MPRHSPPSIPCSRVFSLHNWFHFYHFFTLHRYVLLQQRLENYVSTNSNNNNVVKSDATYSPSNSFVRVRRIVFELDFCKAIELFDGLRCSVSVRRRVCLWKVIYVYSLLTNIFMHFKRNATAQSNHDHRAHTLIYIRTSKCGCILDVLNLTLAMLSLLQLWR